jgi:hypothetical protein
MRDYELKSANCCIPIVGFKVRRATEHHQPLMVNDIGKPFEG